jgi:hypothetical protein
MILVIYLYLYLYVVYVVALATALVGLEFGVGLLVGWLVCVVLEVVT